MPTIETELSPQDTPTPDFLTRAAPYFKAGAFLLAGTVSGFFVSMPIILAEGTGVLVGGVVSLGFLLLAVASLIIGVLLMRWYTWLAKKSMVKATSLAVLVLILSIAIAWALTALVAQLVGS